MVDIHSHILPEVDDGSKSWETSVAMCRMAAADGITHQVATPHANDRYHYDREYLQGLVDHLQSLVGDGLTLSLGCDFHLSYENLQDVLAHPGRYAIGSTHYMLVELSNYSVPPQTTECFTQLGDRGITAIITHPERNPILRDDLQRVVEWAEQGCVIQMTGSALTGFWGERTRRAVLWLLEHDAVHVLATDAHDIEKRIPVLSTGREAVAKLCGEEIAEALVEGNPRAIINDQPLPYFPRPTSDRAYRRSSN
ncbi:MAG: CpsB/CapC family capsule biosynthesis tyrosine phosphatase [Candidatus Sulfotelmatobacter sp.]